MAPARSLPASTSKRMVAGKADQEAVPCGSGPSSCPIRRTRRSGVSLQLTSQAPALDAEPRQPQLGRGQPGLDHEDGPVFRKHLQVLDPCPGTGDLALELLNRGPLDVLVHPETGDDLADHRDRAMWLGDRLPLRLEALGGTD
jgi:hypothetical protein